MHIAFYGLNCVTTEQKVLRWQHTPRSVYRSTAVTVPESTFRQAINVGWHDNALVGVYVSQNKRLASSSDRFCHCGLQRSISPASLPQASIVSSSVTPRYLRLLPPEPNAR